MCTAGGETVAVGETVARAAGWGPTATPWGATSLSAWHTGTVAAAVTRSAASPGPHVHSSPPGAAGAGQQGGSPVSIGVINTVSVMIENNSRQQRFWTSTVALAL